MPDREKVIAELEEHIHNEEWCDNQYPECIHISLLRDALALLKEQEPRVMTWGEVKRMDGVESPPVWLEDREKIHLIPGLGLTTGIMDDDRAAFRVRGKVVTADHSDYGTRWRAWSDKPTDDQRKAVKWDA